jgi:hypothetical protein
MRQEMQRRKQEFVELADAEQQDGDGTRPLTAQERQQVRNGGSRTSR